MLLPWLGLLGLISGCWLEEKDTAPGVSKSRGKKFSDQWGTPPCARDSDKQGLECSLIIAGEAEDGDGCAVVLDSLQGQQRHDRVSLLASYTRAARARVGMVC